MNKILVGLLSLWLCGCAGVSGIKSAPTYGTAAVGGTWTAVKHNELYGAVVDNDTRLDTLEAIAGIVFSDADGTYTDLSVLSSAEVLYLNGVTSAIQDQLDAKIGTSGVTYEQLNTNSDIDTNLADGGTASTVPSSAATVTALGLKLTTTDIDDTPVNAETAAPISSNWAYDHGAAADPHTGYQLEPTEGAFADGDKTKLDALDLDKIDEGDSEVEVVDTGSGYAEVVIDGEQQFKLADGFLHLINGLYIRPITTTDGHGFSFTMWDSTTSALIPVFSFYNGATGAADPNDRPRVILGAGAVLGGIGNMAVGSVWGSPISTNTALTYTGSNQWYSVTAAVTVTLPDVGTDADDAQYGDRMWLVPRDSGEVVTVDLDAADKFNFHGVVQAAGATIATSGIPASPLACIATTDADGSGTDGWYCEEVRKPEHISLTFDPSWAYDQESTYRSLPILYIGDDMKEGFVLYAWKLRYVAGDPTTELNADLICDTTPDHNTAAGATVMDILDTTAGVSAATGSFDSASCANGSYFYLHFGADPTDANVLIALDIWIYY